jgi:hypothetical protein
VRTAELVRRAEQDVAAQALDVDRVVRGVVDGVDPRERAGLAFDAKAKATTRVRSFRSRSTSS